MLYLANANYLYLLLLIPVVLIVYAIRKHLRAKAISKIGDTRLISELMPSYSSAKGWWRIVLFCLAFAFFVIGLARPLIGAKLSERETKGAELMICLDVSNSMLAQDYSPDRLSRAKLAISRLSESLDGDRIGLIIFAGTSFVQLPITTDYVSAKLFLSSIDTESVPVQGTAIGEAILTAARSFSAQSEKSRAIIVITDGENHEDDAIEAAKTVAQTGIRVYTIGVGSVQGQPIPMGGELLKDKNGEIVVTKLNEDILKQIAREGNGAYIHAGNDEFGLNPIIEEIRKLEDERFSSVVFEEYDEQYMYFFAIALFLFVLELLIGERKSKRKLTGTLLVLLLFTSNAGAQEDKHEIREGNRHFSKGRFKQSEISYRKAILRDSTSVPAQYNLASALYRSEDYQGAKNVIDKISDDTAPADCHYNSGDIALQLKDYATAVSEFRRYLLSHPEDLDAKENYIYAKKMLENQQQGGSGEGQDEQDQNKDQQQDEQNSEQPQNENENEQNKDQQPQEEEAQPQQISAQQAQQMLNAIQAREKETQDKVEKTKAELLKTKEKDKNW